MLKKLAYLYIAGSILFALFQSTDANKEQRKYIKDNNLNENLFLKSTCHFKEVCAAFSQVRLSCAEAGDINKCIDIKMSDADHSMCGNDKFVGSLSSDLVPNSFQCFGAKFR